ncbi:MAG: AAA family ATPase [Acidimicrobiales bacterium]|nr:AAA family ATPase [Acidimicrobiales bacterium]
MWVGVLGPVTATSGGEPVVVKGRRQAEALAALALFIGRPVGTDRLVEALWPGDPPPTARRSLQSHLSRLRGALGDDVIARDVAGYRLSHAVTTDVVEFERHLGRAAAATDAVQALAHLAAARSLWRGEPFPELVDWAPAAAERSRLLAIYEGLDDDRLELQLGVGDPAGLVAEASVLVAQQPLRERRWGLLMRALYLAGRQAEALSTFQEARKHLIEAVGVEPGPELRALERAVLEQDPALEAPTSPRVAPTLSVASEAEHTPRFLDLLRERDPLVGRERELARCLDHWDQARRGGRPAVVVVRGEPGIGKTRLAAEVVEWSASAGESVHVARCREGVGVPYAPLAEAFPALSQEVGAASDDLGAGATSPEQVSMARERVAKAFARALERAGGPAPALLLLDDAQWADAPTVEALRWALERELSEPVLLVLTIRSNETPEAPEALDALLADLPRVVDTLDVPLGGVDREAAALIVGHRTPSAPEPEDVDWFFEQSGGSPLYLTELARQAHHEVSFTEVPLSISEIVRRRVEVLADGARDLILAGAVLGEEFDIRTVAAMLARPIDEALDDAAAAVDAQLLYRQADAAFRFSHGITRRAVESTSSTSQLLSLRWAAGALLEGLAAARPEEVADLLLAGAPVGDSTRAARAALAAASSARDHLDPGEALRLLTRAAKILRGVGPDEQRVLAEVLLASADLVARQGEVPDAKQLAAKAAELARALGDPELFARATVGYAELVNAGEADDVAPALCHEALTLLGADHPDWQARVLSALANYHSVVLSDVGSGRPYADRALVVALDDDTRAEALWAKACALLGAAEVEERARVAEKLRACAPPGTRRHVEAVRLTAHTRLELGDRAGYEGAVDELRRLGEDRGSWDALLWSRVASGQVALMEGRIDDSMVAARELEAVSGGSVYAWSLATMQDCHRRLERGQLGELLPMIEALVPQYDLAGVRAVFVQCLLQADEAERAPDVLDDLGRDGFASLRQEQTSTGALALLLEAALDLGRPDDVAALAARLAPHTGHLVVSTQGVFTLGAVDRYLAVAALVAGDDVTAEALLASAAQLETAVGATLAAAYTEVAGQWLRVARGEVPDAQVIGRLRGYADGLGLVRLREHTDAVAEGRHALLGCRRLAP